MLSFVVRPSLCLSVTTFVYCIHIAKDIVKLHSRPGSPIILVFLPRAPVHNSKGTPSVEVLNTRGGENLQLSTEITIPFISETVRNRSVISMER